MRGLGRRCGVGHSGFCAGATLLACSCRMLGTGEEGRLRNIETTARHQSSRRQVIPAAKLLHRDVEAIGHGDERVAVFHPVEGEARFSGGRRGHRDNQGLGGGEIVAWFELVDEGNL